MEIRRLKLKDSVKFEELEKYGFTYCSDGYYTNQFTLEGHFYAYWIHVKTRLIELEISTDVISVDSTLFYLIRDGLVEEEK